MELDFRQNKKKDKTKYSIINLDLFKPGKKKYPEFDYEEIRREHLNESDSSGDDERFHDREALEMVRRLEAKYGNKKTKKGKKIRFGGEDDFIDKAAGYDLEDAFIDDSEAYDEIIPSSMDTQNGGFYVNKGLLEFKWRHEEIDDSDISDTEVASTSEHKKAKKRPLTETTSVEQTTSNNENTSETQANAKVVPQKKSKITTVARLAGGPPTKRFAGVSQASPIQKAAQLIKKKRLTKIKPIATTLIHSPSTLAAKILNGTSSSNITAISTLPQLEQQTTSSSATEGNTTPSKTATFSNTNGCIISTPVRKDLPPLTDTLSEMLDNFKKVTERLAAPGQKKRLQTSHVDLVINIEGQCMKDGFSSHEKSRVLQSVADYIGLHRSSLMLRVQRRKDEVAGKKASTSIGKPLVPENSTQSAPASDSDIQVLDMVVAPKPAAPKEKAENAQQFSNAELEEAKKMVMQLQVLGVATTEMTDLTTSLNIQQFRERFLILIAKKAGAANLLGASSASSIKKVPDVRPAVVTPKTAQAGLAISKTVSNPANVAKMVMSPLKAVATPPKITLGAPVVPPKTVNTTVGMTNGNNVAALTKPKVTLGQYINNEKIDKIPVPPVIDVTVSLTALESELTAIQSVINSAVTSSHTAFNLKVEDCKKSGKQAPIKVNFQFTESLHSALKSLMQRLWQVLCSRPQQKSDTPLSKATVAAEVLENKVCPYFSEMIGFGRLCLEICRRNPENYMLLKAPKVQLALSKEHIDPTSSTIVGKRGVPRAGPANSAASNSVVDDNEIQFVDMCPSTSSKTHTASKQITPTEANIAKLQATNEATRISNAALSGQGIGSTQLAQMQLLLQAIALNGNDVTKLTPTQQTMLLQLQQNMQGPSAAVPSISIQEKATQALKEQRRLEKELERQKREESIALKQRQIEEKKKRLEEEKRLKEKQKAEEKAKKQEEERQRKSKEKEEKELQARLAMEKRMKEEEEKRLREEEIQQQALLKRIKQEEAEQRAQEEKRLNAMREEEEFAAILLQEENLIEDGEIPEEVIKAQEEELEAEEERIRVQREKAEAARAAAAQQVEVKPTPMPMIPLVPIGGGQSMDDYSNERMDVKPLPYQLNNDPGFASPSPVGLPLRSPSFVGNVAASPLNNSPFAYPASHSSGSNIAASPVQQAYQSAIRSPFTQQQHQQSPCNASIQSPQTMQTQQRSSCGMQQNMGINSNNQPNNNIMYTQQNAAYQQNQFGAQQPVNNAHFNAQQQQNIQQQMMQNQMNQRQIQNGYTATPQSANGVTDARMTQQYENQQMLMQQQTQQLQAQQLQAQQLHQQQVMQQMQRDQIMYNQQQSMNSQMNPHFNQQQNYNGRFM